MAMPSSNGSANGFGADNPNAIPRENGLEISPLTPGKSPRFPNFLKGPIEKKIIKDGQVPKRRGPKPDSKPATTRRQELNRQAQRTHRERKEKYIEHLENTAVAEKNAKKIILREKEAAIAQRDAALKEVDRLRALLHSNGIPDESVTRLQPSSQGSCNALSPTWQSAAAGGGSIQDSGPGVHSSAPNSVGHGPSPTSATTSSTPFPVSINHAQFKSEPLLSPRNVSLQEVDMSQLFIDFVLSLEEVCHDHQQVLCERSVQASEPTFHGHLLMISCPPRDHVVNNPGTPYPHKAPDLPSAELMRLLESSDSLPLQGEITPVQALRVIRSHPRFGELTPADLKMIEEVLKPQCRCYGFGAVVEDFVVHDAISQVFATKFSGFNFNDLVG